MSTTTTTVFKNAREVVESAITGVSAKKKEDLVDCVIGALEEFEALAPWPGETFTVWTFAGAERHTTTRTEELPGGVVVEYWGEQVIAVRFPAGAVVGVDR